MRFMCPCHSENLLNLLACCGGVSVGLVWVWFFFFLGFFFL